MTTNRRLKLIRKIALERRGIMEDAIRDMEDGLMVDASEKNDFCEEDLIYDTTYKYNKE